MKSSRWQGLDVGRGLAALAVTLYHYGLGRGLTEKLGSPGWRWLDWPGAFLAVPFFFALSGFVISWIEEPRLLPDPLNRAVLAGYLRRRFWRIYPPYASAVVIAVLVTWAEGRTVSPTDVIAHLGLWHAFTLQWFNSLNPVLWTISTECCFYLLFPVWLALRLRASLPTVLTASVIVTIFSFALSAKFFPDLPAPALMFFLNSWLGWLVGACLADLTRRRSGKLPWTPGHWAGLGVTFLGFAALRAFPSAPLPQLSAVLCAVFLGAWGVYALVRLEPTLQRIKGGSLSVLLGGGVWLGLCSYSLYLIHYPILVLGTLLTSHLEPSRLRSALTASWLGVVLLAAWLHYRWVELPSIRCGQRSAR